MQRVRNLISLQARRSSLFAASQPILGDLFFVGRQIGVDLIKVIKGKGQGVMDVGRAKPGILLDDLLDGHALPIGGQDRGNADAGAGHDRLAAAKGRVYFDVPVVEFWQGESP
jgi:hypothetical protein